MILSIKQTRVVEVPVTELRAAMDVACVATLLDAEGVVVGQSTTPTWLPQVLQIDLESGRIINWRAPSAEQLQAMADSQEVVPTMPADMVAALAHEFQQAGAAPEFADEQDMPYGYFDDERDPVLLAAANATPVQAAEAETVPEGQQPKTPEIEGIKTPEPAAKPSVDIGVSFNKETGRWVADVGNDEVGEHSATSQQGKFEAIKNVLKKAGLHGVYEINQRDLMDDVEFYSYDGSRTLDADTVYVTKGADGWVAKTPSNRPVAGVIGINGELTALLKEMEGIKPEDAVIIETTDDEMRSKGKRRYAVTSRHEYVSTPEAMRNALRLVSTTYGLKEGDALACIASGLVKLAPGKSEKDIGENSMGVLQLTERGNELFSILDRSGIDQDAAAEALKAYLLKDPSFDQLMVAIDACKTPIGLGCIKMHIESLHDKQMQGALHDEINRRMPHMSVAAQKTLPTPEPVAPPTYTDVMAAIEYAATEIHAAKLVNTINGGGFDFDQRTRLHAALNTRIKQIKAAELA